MKASIVIPSYNACERLYYNLLSLSLQDMDKEEFEVIAVDNGSTDNTWDVISALDLALNFRIIRCQQNQGRSKARNIGIQEAVGEIIIFSDSDMISNPDFISSHIAGHKTDKTVVCGSNWDKIYTYYYKDFKGKMLKKFLEIQAKHSHKPNAGSLEDKHCLIDMEHIVTGQYKNYIFKHAIQENSYKRDIDIHGSDLSEYCFPWRFFITNNCSVSKENIIKAGMFDENYQGWGCEDLDLGYRLYKNGCNFVKLDIQSVHQEHPTRPAEEGVKNMYRFTEKYDTAEILLFYFSSFAGIESNSLSAVMRELKLLEWHPEVWDIISIFKDMLKIVRDRALKINQDKTTFYHNAKKSKNEILSNKKRIIATLNDMDACYGCISFTAAFKKISVNLFKINLSN